MKRHFPPTPEGFRKWVLDQPTLSELFGWCELAFGSGPHAGPTHRELLDAIPEDHNYKVRGVLARLVAEALSNNPSLDMPYRGKAVKDYVLTEFLALAHGLERPDILAGPLWSAYLRLSDEKRKLATDVRIALLDAMTYNQVWNVGLKTVWMEMVQGKLDHVLLGTRELGFRGIAFMPSEQNDGEPDGAAIVTGLLELAKSYADDKENRRERFRQRVRLVERLWPDKGPAWFVDLLKDDGRWAAPETEWAVVEWPELNCVDFGTRSGDMQNARCIITQRWIASLIDHVPDAIVEAVRLKGGLLVQLSFQSNDNAQSLLTILRSSIRSSRLDVGITELQEMFGAVIVRMVQRHQPQKVPQVQGVLLRSNKACRVASELVAAC